jgi:hypothetical protein
MSWDILLMKAPDDALITEDVPESYGNLGKVAKVIECLRTLIPQKWFDNPDDGTLPVAWFTTENIWGGVDCEAYGLRIYLQTSEREVDPFMPVTATDTVECVFLEFHPVGNPHKDMNHPVWDFIAAACRALECRAEDDARFLGPDGRPIPVPEPKRPWWQFWR